ncbi:hypothetical protein D3Z33_11940 [Senegalia massiliensis]|uniref:Uncharacterized protein n=1 Tax=Senegalia massiliensis TaxID=1720316 RepID=A0A845R2B0_9CLOT|nr:hypothetical protein [Senegalia massiliensis]
MSKKEREELLNQKKDKKFQENFQVIINEIERHLTSKDIHTKFNSEETLINGYLEYLDRKELIGILKKHNYKITLNNKVINLDSGVEIDLLSIIRKVPTINKIEKILKDKEYRYFFVFSLKEGEGLLRKIWYEETLGIGFE